MLDFAVNHNELGKISACAIKKAGLAFFYHSKCLEPRILSVTKQTPTSLLPANAPVKTCDALDEAYPSDRTRLHVTQEWKRHHVAWFLLIVALDLRWMFHLTTQ